MLLVDNVKRHASGAKSSPINDNACGSSLQLSRRVTYMLDVESQSAVCNLQMSMTPENGVIAT